MSDEPPYETIADELLTGTVVPFFGSAASAIYRPPDAVEWDIGKPYLPFGAELAAILARASNYLGSRAAYDDALSELVDAATVAAPGIPAADIRAALQPVLRKYVGGPRDWH